MQMRTGILIGVTVLLGFVTFFLMKMYLDSKNEGYRRQAAAATKQQQIQTAEILVAKTNLPAGTRIKRENVEWRAWPKTGVVKTHFVKGDKKLEDVLGFIVRRGLMPGEPLVQGKIVEQGDRGYMAALLDPGMRAVSIRVRPDTSVSGFIKPGDRVDVLSTFSFKPVRKGGNVHYLTDTILTDILVVAVATVTNDQDTKPSAGANVTLQVTPKQAQIFTVGQRVGSMSLVLRSLAHEQYFAVNDVEPEEDSKAGKKSTTGKGGKSGRKTSAGNAKKTMKTASDAKPGKGGKSRPDAQKDSSEETVSDEKLENPEQSLRTWDSEISQALPQIGGRRKAAEGFEIVRGNRSQRIYIIEDKKKDAENVGESGKDVARDSATGFQAGQRAAGTAASTLR